MINSKYLLVLVAASLVFILVSPNLLAQVPINLIGGNPPSLNWKQIRTESTLLVFPEALEDEAQKVASLVDYYYYNSDNGIGNSLERVPILLQNQGVLGNGFVTVGPFRSEFFPTPRQFRASNDFLHVLTIHEYEHIRQFSKATVGITKAVRKVLGSWAWGGMVSMALPRWYLEGGAVMAETKLSENGRGRFGPFIMEYKALFKDGQKLNFEKAAAGSLVDFVPSWYHLGYHMLSYGEERFGTDIWGLVSDDAARFKGIFFPFSRNLKRRTGWKAAELYRATMSNLEDKWSSEINENPEGTNQLVTGRKNSSVIHYSNPHFSPVGGIISEKTSYSDLTRIVLIDKSGNEKLIVRPGVLTQRTLGRISHSAEMLAWTALSIDPRWQNKQYSDIYVFDPGQQKKRRLTYHGRFFSPDLNEEATSIVAVQVDEAQDQRLVIFDVDEGLKLQVIELPAYETLQFPTWSSDDKIIVVATRGQQNELVLVDPGNGESRVILKGGAAPISHPIVHDLGLFFSWGVDGINNIYRLHLDNGQVDQITHSEIGALQPSVSEDGMRLVYTEFSSSGFNIFEKSIIEIPPKVGEITSSPMYHSFYENQDDKSPPTVEESPFEVFHFNKWTGILNPHSLLAEFQHPTASLRLLSDNYFGTMTGEVGAYYNYNESEWSYRANLVYAELFPVLNAGFVHANRSALFFNYSALSDSTFTRSVSAREWSENRTRIGVAIPLRSLNGNFWNSWRISADYRYMDINSGSDIDSERVFLIDTLPFENNQAIIEDIYAAPLSSGSFHSLDLGLSFQSVRRSARLNLRPQVGISMAARYRLSMANGALGGNVFTFSGNLYLPGIKKNHSLSLIADYQSERMLDNYRYSDLFSYPRGYDLSIRRDRYIKWGVNYRFPLFYPDKAIGPLAFVKRLKANIFYDHGIVKVTETALPSSKDLMRSVGCELNVDFRALRLVEIDVGMRYSYLLDDRFALGDNRHIFEFFVVSITQ